MTSIFTESLNNGIIYLIKQDRGDKVEDNKFNIVVKSNDLIQSSQFNLSTQEQKILIYLISKIMPNTVELTDIEFNIYDFCNCIGIDSKNGANYIYIRDLIHSMSDINLKVLENGSYKNKRIIDVYDLPIGSSTATIKLHSSLEPYLLNLKKNFTQYELFYILNFKSKYSIRLYELFKSYEFKRKLEIEIDDLQRMLQSNYSRFVDFKRKVIEIALKEINKETDIEVEVEYIKVGRSYKKAKFTIKNWSKEVTV